MVRAFTHRLDNAVSQRTNIVALRPLLAQLKGLHAEREGLTQRAGEVFTHVRETFSAGVAITREMFDEKMSLYDPIIASYKAQVATQDAIITNVMVRAFRPSSYRCFK